MYAFSLKKMSVFDRVSVSLPRHARSALHFEIDSSGSRGVVRLMRTARPLTITPVLPVFPPYRLNQPAPGYEAECVMREKQA